MAGTGGQNPVVRVLALILCLLGAPVLAAPLLGVPWTVSGNFEEYDKSGARVSTNISAAVCLPDGGCFAGSDETRFLQRFTWRGKTLKVGGRLYLAPTKSKPKAERKDFDIEALALSGTTLIAVGSHSWARKKCQPRSRNQNVFILETDPLRIQTRLSLQAAFEKFPILDHFNNRPLQQNGLNIEGVAALNGIIHFGFRAPYVDGSQNRVLILSVALAALKQGDFNNARLRSVLLNNRAGQGIRGMETLGNTILLLAGNAGPGGKGQGACANASPLRDIDFSLHLWHPEARSTAFLGNLRLPDSQWKAEGLLLTEPPTEDRNSAGVVVFFDGPQNGAPHHYWVQMGE